MKILGKIFLVLFILGQLSCAHESGLFTKSLSEGKIEFAVTFPMMDDDNVLKSILPDKMSVSFKDDQYNSEFNTYGGVFKNKICVDTRERSYTQMLKIFKKKLACNYDTVDIDQLLRESAPFTIIKSDRNDTIAGIPCKVATGVFFDMNSPSIDIYYTDRIKVDNPNWGTPFAELDGFLLGYEVDMFNMRMRLMAEHVKEEVVEASEFEVEGDYKKVSYKYIKVELEKLIETFDI